MPASMINKQSPNVGVAVITHNARHHLRRCLQPLLNSPVKPRILVVNSSSSDGTVQLAEELGAEVLLIPRVEFNHGATRERARRYLQTNIVAMITPDAYLANEHSLGQLIAPLIRGEASAAYARQVPHDGAGFFEAFAREYNYPEKSHLRGIEDVDQYGVYTFFCSNSCAAYDNAILEKIGGFQPVLLGEDTVAVAKMLRLGYKIAYVAEAVASHSHNYSLMEEFRRNFDIGLARKEYEELLSSPKGDTCRGLEYAKQMIKRLLREAPAKIPYAIAHIFSKWTGYRLGKQSVQAPVWLKKALSSQDFYWTSRIFVEKD